MNFQRVIHLRSKEPVIHEPASGAPSLTLPAYAAAFRPELGRTFAPTPSFDEGRGDSAVILPKAHFVNGLLTEPDAVRVAVPRGAAIKPSHEAPMGLLTPLERREAMGFEKAWDRARRAHRAEKAEACRRALLMRKTHPSGVQGVEGPGGGSAVYSEEATALRDHDEAREQAAAARRTNLWKRQGGGGGGAEPRAPRGPNAAFSSDAWASRGQPVPAPARRCLEDRRGFDIITGAATDFVGRGVGDA